jgi:hypothetical protein
MQKERKPDLNGANNDAVEEKVKAMMESAPEKDNKIEAKADAPDASDPAEVTELPTPKEPLKIKILNEPEVEPTTAPEPPKLSKKKIDVDHQEETPIAEPESEVTSSDPESGEVSEESGPPETTEPEPSIKEPEIVNDEETAKAVDDIAASDGDEILAAEDEKRAAFQPPKKPGLGQRFKHLLGTWWRNPKSRYATLTILFLGLIVAGIVPKSRYFLLNTAQVRSNLSLQVLDQSTQQPLKNVRVSINGASALTGADGKAVVSKVKLGPSYMVIEKRAFAPIRQTVTVGWGSNPLGEFKLTPTGTQYAFIVSDYLSGKGVEGIEASSGEASALSDKNGKILLTMDQPEDQFEVSIKGAHFREEKLKIDANNKAPQTVTLVPDRKEVFISKRSGKYDVYKIDIDGKNEEKILTGTGLERDDMVLISHPSDEEVALVSTRDNKRNQDGFLLSTLTLVDLGDNKTTTVTQSERIQILDWVGDRLVYVQVQQGASAANPKRNRLMSYNYKTGENIEIASSNYFNDVAVIGTKVYYAPSSAYQNGVNSSLFKVDADGGNRQPILDKEVWNFFRTSYDHIVISSSDNHWYDYKLGDKSATKLDGQPGNLNGRVYVDGPDSKKSLWVDNRDGKGVLLAYEPGTQNEQILRSQSGLKIPVRWLNDNTVIYRINTDQETADYALSLNGGQPKKIRDVTNTGGVDKWYYY